MRYVDARLLMVQQTEYAFGNDVVLDLERAAIDSRRLAAEPAAHAVEFGLAEALAFPTQALRSHDLHQQLATVLADTRAGVLHDRSGESRTGIAFGLRHRTLDRQHEGTQIHHVIGDPRAQIGIGDAALGVGADILLGDLIERASFAAAIETATAWRAADALPFELQEAFADCPAAIERTHQVFLRHLHVGEKGLAERRVAADQLDGAYLHARRFHVDQEERDAFMLLGVVGAHEAETPIGILRAAGPDLLAIDEIVIALVDALCAQRCKIGSRAGLGIALAPPNFTLHDSRNVLFLLLLTAIFEQGRAEHHHAHTADRIESADAVHLLLQHARLRGRKAAAAILLGIGWRAPTLVAHRLLPLREVSAAFRAILVDHHGGLALQRGRKILFQPLARLCSEGFQIAVDFLSCTHDVAPPFTDDRASQGCAWR